MKEGGVQTGEGNCEMVNTGVRHRAYLKGT